VDTGETVSSSQAHGEIAGVDLGEAHIAAVLTTRRNALLVSGRRLRADKQGRNKVHVVPQEKRSRCQPGSRRATRLQQRTAQVSAKPYRQQRDLLQKARRKRLSSARLKG
jgi:hypothetical protein